MATSSKHSADPTTSRRLPTPGQTPVRFEYSPRLPEILQHLQSSLAITTYQAGKLAIVGVEGDHLDFSFHDFEHAMVIPMNPAAGVHPKRPVAW